MDYDETIEQLIAEEDLDTEAGRRRAYRKCIEYAQTVYAVGDEFNLFLSEAAERLGQWPIRGNTVLQAVEHEGDEKLFLAYYQESGPTLYGNRSGLAYLAQICERLSQASVEGEHVHFYHGQFPLVGDSYPLTVYKETDDWIEGFCNDTEAEFETDDDEPEIVARAIDPGTIRAFLTVEVPPPTFPVTNNKIYRVLKVEKIMDQECWKKTIRESDERLYVFEFVNDDNETDNLAIDLDDDAVLFFRDYELEQLK